MKIPIHIIGERRRREEEKRRREQGRRLPVDSPEFETSRNSPSEKTPKKREIVIEM